GHVHGPAAAERDLLRGSRSVAAAEDPPHLCLEGMRGHSERIVPTVGDPVVTEDERAAHRRIWAAATVGRAAIVPSRNGSGLSYWADRNVSAASRPTTPMTSPRPSISTSTSSARSNSWTPVIAAANAATIMATSSPSPMTPSSASTCRYMLWATVGVFEIRSNRGRSNVPNAYRFSTRVKFPTPTPTSG